MSSYSATLVLRGLLEGHNGWVTSIATTPENPDMLLSSSRDKTILVWQITKGGVNNYATIKKSLKGHSHFVSDVVISSDAMFALSGSWDGTLRLWDLSTGATTRSFVGHSKDVLSVAFSADNRQIVSGSRDKTIKIWNTLGECKFTIEEQGHTDWVSTVRFSPSTNNPLIVSGGWDKLVKVWTLPYCKLKTTLIGHSGYINTVTISPDGSLCASGGKDGTVMLWDLKKGTFLSSLDSGSVVNALTFSPNRYWLVAATKETVKIWHLETKEVEAELTRDAPGFFNDPSSEKLATPSPISLAWSSEGNFLYVGYTDNNIRVWEVIPR